jgi:helicase
MKKKEKGYRGYRFELQKAVSEKNEEGKEIFKRILEKSTRLDDEEERAIKKALMLYRWISLSDTKEVENEFFVYSGAIKRVGEDFSWLAGTLADLAREMEWPEKAVQEIDVLSQRLVYGSSKEGLPLSRIRLRGLGRTYINQLVREGYNNPETITEVPFEQLERILPKRLAQRLHKYCTLNHGSTEPKSKPALPVNDTWQVIPFSEIIGSNGRLSHFRSRLAMTKNLSELVTDPPTIVIDQKQNLFFYQGHMVYLAPTTFKLMFLLANRPGEVITRDEIYSHLWPDFSNPDASVNPYDRQISDHKRKIVYQIKKSTSAEDGASFDKINKLIKTMRKVGYVLNLKNEEAFLLI